MSKNKDKLDGLRILQASACFMFANISLGKGSHMASPGARVGGTMKFHSKGHEIRKTLQIRAILKAHYTFLNIAKLKIILYPPSLEALKIKSHILEFTFWTLG